MTKNLVITSITEKVNGLTKKDATVVFEAVAEVIADAMKAGEEVTLPGVGKFISTDVPEKTMKVYIGSNAGGTTVVPAHKKVTFRTASALKEALK